MVPFSETKCTRYHQPIRSLSTPHTQSLIVIMQLITTMETSTGPFLTIQITWPCMHITTKYQRPPRPQVHHQRHPQRHRRHMMKVRLLSNCGNSSRYNYLWKILMQNKSTKFFLLEKYFSILLCGNKDRLSQTDDNPRCGSSHYECILWRCRTYDGQKYGANSGRVVQAICEIR